MRQNTQDKTILRNYLSKWQFLIEEYELVKAKKHPKFRFAQDFYRAHNINRQTFFKYYHRHKLLCSAEAFIPWKRGRRWQERLQQIERLVLKYRYNGFNRYEICRLLKPTLQDKTPSPSTIYRICKRHNLNRLTPKMKTERRQIIKRKAGELGHIDCHYLSRDLLVKSTQKHYLVCIIDACTRLAWVEVVDDLKSLTVMFASMRVMNYLSQQYQIEFARLLSDNGSEFASKRRPEKHPFERMLIEMGIKHSYTRPFRPQTNGKVERFWRTLNEELLDETTFETVEEFKKELERYMLYYNELRPHQGIDNKTPKELNQSCERFLSTN